MEKINIFWFRRDLRLHDNNALLNALKSGRKILAIFIFDKEILKEFPFNNDRRLTFIYDELKKLNNKLNEFGSSMLIMHEKVQNSFEQILKDFNVETVYCNEDYEPDSIIRDTEIKKYLESKAVGFSSFKDQVIFEKNEIVKSDKTPYTVFTPYSKQWKLKIETQGIINYKSEDLLENFLKLDLRIPELEEIGYNRVDFTFPEREIKETVLKNYAKTRDFPYLDSCSRLGIHFRFGTISVREAVAKAQKHSEVWLSELIWREFFMQILWHFPHVEKNSFRKKYDLIEWSNDEEKFEKWCRGETGFAIVDAGMKELVATGYMHNRVRMITANFLTKLLLIDWRWGERFFAEHLLDYELASNNGNWQWAAGTGADAAPYFRIFNPYEQIRKFDKDNIYINKWLNADYYEKHKPIIDYKEARKECLEVYSRIKI